MRHVIQSVGKGSVAERFGLRAGDALLRIGGEDVLDEIDYQALIAGSELTLDYERDGKAHTARIRKDEGEPLGLRFGDSMTLSPRTCHNKCVFCFIDQMPKGMRDTLYVKDDDWRYSLMMGNFVTLTNVDDAELDRIIRRHVSPLYVSVHTTDPELRRRMMNNRFAGDILERLARLKDAGIQFHCQIVVCPGWNDGEELMRTLRDLRALSPAARSVALVPVGLTKCREGLEKLAPFDREGANRLLDEIAPFQQECLKEFGSTFVFPSDEFFCLAGREVPPEGWYEGFPQIENGVGLLRQLESQMEEAAQFDDEPYSGGARRYLIPTGVSAESHIARLCARYAPEGVSVRTLAVKNRFFGETVTVTGLLTGGDLLQALEQDGAQDADEILLSDVVLRHEQDRFLDDMTLEEFIRRAPLPVRFSGNDGQSLYDALRARGNERESNG